MRFKYRVLIERKIGIDLIPSVKHSENPYAQSRGRGT
jgi:hypothetical protein